ncbi:MAG: acetyl-CoA synthetase [Acidimicrobiaceae bacterium]|jgi:hypothetical protein|nr:acetyl-CoA synthetase [Acidimicrobiaceae bacterium]
MSLCGPGEQSETSGMGSSTAQQGSSDRAAEGSSDPADQRQPAFPPRGAVDEDGRAYLLRVATARDRGSLDKLRAEAEAVGGTHSYFGIPAGHGAGSPAVTTPWPEGGTTVVAESGEVLIAAARFLRIGTSTEATVAVAVGDIPSQHDVGSRLVEALAFVAHAVGIEHLVADLLTTNAAMLAIFVRAGFATEISVGDGVMHMSFSVDPRGRDAGRSQVKAVPVWRSNLGSCRS